MSSQRERSDEITLTLAVLDCIKPPDYCFSQAELCEIVGINLSGISKCERRALRKCREAMFNRFMSFISGPGDDPEPTTLPKDFVQIDEAWTKRPPISSHPVTHDFLHA